MLGGIQVIYLSVIIPFYNSERTLYKTTESLCKQINEDVELLLIDDGSESYIEHSVINSQFKNTAQVRWFKKKHEGVSSARNTGIRNACGEYIWFADADDILAENSIDTILKHIKNGLSVDIIWGNHRKYTINGFLDRQEFDYGNGDWIRSCNSNTDQLLAYIYSGPLKTAGVWNNVYKKSVILNNQIWFDQSLILYEDVDWLIKMILVSKKIDFIRSPIYYYQTAVSYTHLLGDFADVHFLKLRKIADICWTQIENILNAELAGQYYRSDTKNIKLGFKKI